MPKKRMISIKEQMVAANALWSIEERMHWIQIQHLLVLWNKYGQERVLLCFENWNSAEFDNLVALRIIKVLKACSIKPKANRRFKHPDLEKLRSIV